MSSKTAFLEHVLKDPGQVYRRAPINVVRDRRLTNAERLQVLHIWENIAKTADSDEHDLIEGIALARKEVERSIKMEERHAQ